MSYLYCYSGPWHHPSPFSSELTKPKKMTKNVRWTTIGRHTHLEASTSGFHDSHTPSVGRCAWLRTGAPTGPAKRLTSMVLFCFFYYGFQPRILSGAIRSKYSPDGGIQWLCMKPWTPSIVDVSGVAPAHHLECQHGLDGGAFVRHWRIRDRPIRS